MKVMVVESVHVGECSSVEIESTEFLNHGVINNRLCNGDVRISFGSTKNMESVSSVRLSLVLHPSVPVKRTDTASKEIMDCFSQMDHCKAIIFKSVNSIFNVKYREKSQDIKFIHACKNTNITLHYNSSKKQTVSLKSTDSRIAIISQNENTRFKIIGCDELSRFNFSGWQYFRYKSLAILPKVITRMEGMTKRLFMTSIITCIRSDITPIQLMTDQKIDLFFRKNMNMPSSSSSSRHGRNPRQASVASSAPMRIIDLTKEESASVAPVALKTAIPDFAIKQPIRDKFVPCIICEEWSATVVTSPCLHDVLCADCYVKMEDMSKTNKTPIQCPICKTRVVERMFAAPYSVQREIRTTE